MQHSFLVGFLALALVSATPAQEIKLLDLGGNLFSMDPKTAEMQYIGSSGLFTHLWQAMAMDSQGRMYAAYGRYFAPYEIYEINPVTGQATFVLQTSFIGIFGMAFDANDVLYLTNARDAPFIGGPVDLHTLDLATGATTLIGETGSFQIQSLDFHAGELYAYAHLEGLFKIDPLTGVSTDVDPNSSEPPTYTATLCVSDSGALFYFDDYLFMIDPPTGTFSFAARGSFYSFWAGSAFVEGPEDPFALWIGGATGGPITVNGSGATPHGNVALVWERGDFRPAGPTPIPLGFPCAGTPLSLSSTMQLFGIRTADANGEFRTPPQFVPAGAKRDVRIQAIDLASCEASNRILIFF